MALTDRFKLSLLRWQLRQLLVVNVLAILATSLYVLFRSKPMVSVDAVELLAVFAHGGLLVWSLGRVGSRRVGFLYMLGFTRDQIAFQTLLASAVSGLLVCGAAWLLMVSGARSLVQDSWYENMYFPFIAPEEYFVPWVWLLGYAVFLPLMYYVWIRSAQPYRGTASGWMLLVLGLYFCAWSFDRSRFHASEPTFLLGVAALYVPAAVADLCLLARSSNDGGPRVIAKPFFGAVPIIAVFAVLSVVALAGIVPIAVRAQRWLPIRQPARPPGVRRLEAMIVIALTLPVFLLLLYEQPLMGQALGLLAGRREHAALLFAEHLSEDIRLALLWFFAIAAASVMISAVCSWKLSTTLAAALLAIVFGWGVGKFTTWQNEAPGVYHVPGFGDRQRETGHILFELRDGIEADLSINGVYVGKTPYRTTIHELAEKVPDTASARAAAGDTAMARLSAGTHALNRRALSPFYRGASVDLKKAIEPFGAFQYRPDGKQPKIASLQTVMVQVELNGMIGYTQSVEGWPNDDGLVLVTLDTHFEEWQKGLDQLLYRARLDDYDPPPEWYDALLSYESLGWGRLQSRSKLEPKFLLVVDRCAAHAYGIDQVESPQQAWAALKRITDEATAKGSYHSDSWRGRAVDLLVPKLDPKQLTSELVKALDRRHFPLTQHRLTPSKTSGGVWKPRPRWKLPDPPEVIALQVLFQAAWELDRTLNKEQPNGANIVERRVTPALLRHTLRDPFMKPYAEALGGPAYERFVLRHDWQTSPDEFATLDENQQSAQWLVGVLSRLDTSATGHFASATTVSIGNTQVNRWFYELMYLDSEEGRRFRQQHRERLLKIAIQSLEPVVRKKPRTEQDRLRGMIAAALLSNAPRTDRFATPPHLEFLFLDHDTTTRDDSLAFDFWPYYDAKLATSDRLPAQALLKLRWNYLARLWPESTIDMFVAAYPDRSPLNMHGPTGNRRTAHLLLPDTLPQEVRFAILSGVRDRLQAELQQQTDERRKSSMAKDIDALASSIRQIPCLSNVKLLLEEYEAGETSGPLNQLHALIANDITHHDLLGLLATHDNPELRRLALVHIQSHPVVDRRRLLKAMLTDADAAVRAEATKVDQQLERLRNTPPKPRPKGLALDASRTR